MPGLHRHWNKVFAAEDDPGLGWYERDASQTLKFFEDIPGWDRAAIFLPGAGTSTLVNELVARNGHLILNDISDEALDKLKDRFSEYGARITWLNQDISKSLPDSIPASDIWIDRAVLHFLIDDRDIVGYFDNLRGNLRHGGHVLLAEFSLSGAKMCAGLPVHRYSTEELSGRLGEEFSLLRHEDYMFINPAGDERPYVYALFRRE